MDRVWEIREVRAGYYAADGQWVNEDDEVGENEGNGDNEDEEAKALREKRFLRQMACRAAGRPRWMTFKVGSPEHKAQQE